MLILAALIISYEVSRLMHCLKKGMDCCELWRAHLSDVCHVSRNKDAMLFALLCGCISAHGGNALVEPCGTCRPLCGRGCTSVLKPIAPAIGESRGLFRARAEGACREKSLMDYGWRLQ